MLYAISLMFCLLLAVSPDSVYWVKGRGFKLELPDDDTDVWDITGGYRTGMIVLGLIPFVNVALTLVALAFGILSAIMDKLK